MSFGAELEQERERVVRLVRHASVSWAEAMRAHKLAPPDEGFATRLQRLSEAAAAEQLAWQQAHDAGMQWRPVAGAASAEPPYELRPGTGRRGPEDLWLHFDSAVMEMNRAIAGSDALEVAAAFGAVAEAAAKLARTIADEDDITREAKELARSRNAA
ncbi:MAG TPA: hypothetical protein VHU61_13695 [Solirubrobacteraceae bacterium]|jgi:hypothetical protein|nr:hypothetical protein [Solirubrobacteraceae bacterium]